MTSFTTLPLKKPVQQALASLSFTEMTEVQEKILPTLLAGKNVAFTSRTGSGKTLAYLLGYVGKINSRQGLQMLVVVPTRELCIQVGKEISRVCELLDISVGTLYGGRDASGDYRTLRKKNQIIVATPGRLLLHVNEKTLKVGDVKYLVFDESDQMFDDGFFDDCCYLRERVSSIAQLVLVSATMTERVQLFVEQAIPNCLLYQVGELVPKSILQQKIECDKLEKNEILLSLFTREDIERTIIFCNTKVKSQNICDFLCTNGFKATSLTGNLEQKERQKHLLDFKRGKISILVATDVAARGLHIETVDLVINYDVPTREEFYVHRIGRTGRVGKRGRSLTLICPEDVDRFYSLQRTFDLRVKELGIKK